MRSSNLHVEIEELDENGGLTNVYAHDVPVVGLDAQQSARASTLGVFGASLDDHALVEQITHEVAHGGSADPGRLADLLSGHRAVVVDSRQRSGTVALAEVINVDGPGPCHLY